MDSATLALCHFCDIHGPRLLMSTQAIQGTNSPDYKLETQLNLEFIRPVPLNATNCPSHKTHSIRPVTATTSISSSLTLSADSTCAGCSIQLPNTSPGYITAPNYDCRHLPVYITKQYPTCNTKLMQLKRCCARVFSFEQTASKEGVIVFGNLAHGFAISKKFYLKDMKARGLQRLYCFFIFTKTKLYLYQNFNALSNQLESLAELLKNKSEQIFTNEQKKDSLHSNSNSVPINLHPTDRFRIPNDRFHPRFRNNNNNNNNNNVTPRSLREITGDDDIYSLLHTHHTAILANHTPKIIKLSNNNNNNNSNSNNVDSIVDIAYSLSSSSELVSPLETPSLYSEQKETFTSIRHFARTIGAHIFDQLLYHLYIGNQIIIKCDSKHLVSSAIQHLATLLPEKCVSARPHETSYLPLSTCNLLGVSSSCSTPSMWSSDTNDVRGIILDIYQLGGDTLGSSNSSSDCDTDSGVGMTWQDDFLENYVYQIQPDLPLLYKYQLLLPTVLTHLHSLIYPKLYSEAVMKMCIQNTKDSITTKSIALSKYRNLHEYASSSTRHALQNKLLHAIQASQGDVPFLRFWAKSLD